jgi:hypothetical protein
MPNPHTTANPSAGDKNAANALLELIGKVLAKRMNPRTALAKGAAVVAIHYGLTPQPVEQVGSEDAAE